MRNFFVDYRGGASTRPGTLFCGESATSGASIPPRLIPFIFSVAANQTYALEFGDFYMRVLLDGAYVLTGSGAIYSLLTPYAIADVALLKFDQSADVMSITHQSYAPRDLTRISANNWTLTPTQFTAAISAPGAPTVVATTTGTPATTYSYLVTAIDRDTGQESVASPPGEATDSVNIATTAGSLNISWNSVTGASGYNIYKAPPAYNVRVPIGSRYGYCGSSVGLGFIDSNITPDYTTTAPLHLDPFAPASVSYVTVSNGGSADYHQATTTATITSVTGSGAVLTPIVQAIAGGSEGGSDAVGPIVGVIVVNGGTGYLSTDTIIFTDTDGTPGAGAVAALHVNPSTGTYPGSVSYFQQRRVYANSLNQPDTYWMSKPGNYTNFDISDPTTDGDSIQGTPWARQINGISWLVPMPGGLVVLTGKGAWQISGNGTKGSAITPSAQEAEPQSYNGCSNTVQPVVINYDILYVGDGDGIVYDLSYNFFTQIYTGQDIIILSNHLVENRRIVSWCWSQKPHKIVWVVLDDGTLLSLTFLKEQEVLGWARHDTAGQFVSCCTIPENGFDSVYFIVRRYIRGVWKYYAERMDNRLWRTVEDTWAVDCGLRLPQSTPAATLTASATSGNNVYFTTSASAFGSAAAGDVIRMGGGIATITNVFSDVRVMADITTPIKTILRNRPATMEPVPLPAASGDWTLTRPVSSVSGLDHLESETVAILADGSVQTQRTVSAGAVTLDAACSSVTVGLPFQCQLQSLYFDVEGAPTVQGKRKSIEAVTVRFSKSRGAKIGVNQVDASTQPDQEVQVWTRLVEFKERSNNTFAGTAIPLYTGDYRAIVSPDWKKQGQVSIQQDYPLPLTISAIIPEYEIGDTNG